MAFRVTKDVHFDIWYIEKKFLFWWFMYPIDKVASTNIIKGVYEHMKHGHYNFDFKKPAHYFFIIDHSRTDCYCEIEYYKDVEDFKLKNAEYLI